MADFDNPPAMSFADVAKAAEDLSAPAFASILFAFNDEGDIAENVGMPCYLDKGAPPEKSDQACSKTEQRQPDFDGRQSFYNSGIIPYEGGNGNTFKVKLADDIEPGTYLFYCAVHGPGQLSEIEVKDRDAEVPSQGDSYGDPPRDHGRERAAREGVPRGGDNNRFTLDDEAIEGPFAGLYSPKNDHALINEFIPRELRVKAGEPVTWKMFGSDHTISFGVPRYFPIIDFSGGHVKINAKLGEPAGGAPKPPMTKRRSTPAPTTAPGSGRAVSSACSRSSNTRSACRTRHLRLRVPDPPADGRQAGGDLGVDQRVSGTFDTPDRADLPKITEAHVEVMDPTPTTSGSR